MGNFIRDCGHKTSRGVWDNRPDENLSGLCVDCRAARIGEEIDFLRFGKPPVGGQSHNHREGQAEEGISVYELRDGEPVFTGWHFGICERSAFTGRGRIVGWGSDEEPLVEILSIRRDKKFDRK